MTGDDGALLARVRLVMLAVQLQAPGVVRTIEAPGPALAPRRVRVRIAGSGVCGSNLPVWEGRPWFTYPLPPGAPGHEGWGQVDGVGAEVRTVTPGDHVALLSQHAFAEYDVADEADVVPLPAGLSGSFLSGFPGEALACAVNVMRRSGVGPGRRVAIVGVGFLGAVLVCLAARAGAQVTALSRRRFALDFAGRLGAVAQVPLGGTGHTAAEARDANGGEDFDVVIEATGLQAPLDVAGRITRTRGRLVIAGYHQDGPRHVDLQLWNWRGLDVINAHERDPRVYAEGLREAVSLVHRGVIPLPALVTHRFPLARAHEAFRCAAERPDGFLKAIVTGDAA